MQYLKDLQENESFSHQDQLAITCPPQRQEQECYFIGNIYFLILQLPFKPSGTAYSFHLLLTLAPQLTFSCPSVHSAFQRPAFCFILFPAKVFMTLLFKAAASPMNPENTPFCKLFQKSFLPVESSTTPLWPENGLNFNTPLPLPEISDIVKILQNCYVASKFKMI